MPNPKYLIHKKSFLDEIDNIFHNIELLSFGKKKKKRKEKKI